MTQHEFDYLLHTIKALTPEQLRLLRRELDHELVAAECRPGSPSQGSLGAMSDSAEELNAALQHAMSLRERRWRTRTGK